MEIETSFLSKKFVNPKHLEILQDVTTYWTNFYNEIFTNVPPLIYYVISAILWILRHIN